MNAERRKSGAELVVFTPEPFDKALRGPKPPFVDARTVGTHGELIVKSHTIERFRRHDRVTPPHSKR